MCLGLKSRREGCTYTSESCAFTLPRAQVACFADHHIKVLKHLQPPSNADTSNISGGSRRNVRRRGRVTTRFAVLSSYEQRVREVAEMMGE
jgi:DNA repair ATPase RecN